MTALLSDHDLSIILNRYSGRRGRTNPHICQHCYTPIQHRERLRAGVCMTCAKKDPALFGLGTYA